MNGHFFVLEGMDGTGKTTQAERLCQHLQSQGRDVLHLREPGTTDAGERLRASLLATDRGPWHARTEALVFFAARNELLQVEIMPALQMGRDVVCERFTPSTLAYQGQDPADAAFVLSLDELVVAQEGQPDCVLILECSLEEASKRMSSRPGEADSFEQRDLGFHAQVQSRYRRYAEARPQCAALVDADGSPDQVEERLLQTLRDRNLL